MLLRLRGVDRLPVRTRGLACELLHALKEQRRGRIVARRKRKLLRCAGKIARTIMLEALSIGARAVRSFGATWPAAPSGSKIGTACMRPLSRMVSSSRQTNAAPVSATVVCEAMTVVP